ncbi:cytochrome b561 and DOMON domain-containing protein At3g59070-like [Gastrolobium bilobum]|uniref:cytochrome b561 and DOMON domain-containing protein At3g59070-like n=1 Tax=Gastrolobium bilobum TaxID=150636 RepID=UPI002AB0B22D|nr:cytochrome b561 and DOMON domain-containing protein At3g59070-like [Gastrolobium bilobum]
MFSVGSLILFLTVFTHIFVSRSLNVPKPCSSYTFPNHINYAACKDLQFLESSLHWNYYPSSRTVDLAFKKENTTDSSWIAWAINPTSKCMVGSQAFVAVPTSYGTLKAYTSPITSYVTLLQHGNLSFPVHNVSAIYTNGHKIIFASFQLPSNVTLVTQVWQEGFSWDDGNLKAHFLSGPNLQSFGTLDFISANVSEIGVKVNSSNTTLKKVHGILNSFSWGFLMPLGVIFGHYMKEFEFDCGAPARVLHLTCVSLAFFIGSVGCFTGLYLGNHNHSGVHNASHRFVGITLMYLTYVQLG